MWVWAGNAETLESLEYNAIGPKFWTIKFAMLLPDF
jgi:hypothetical protein